ncbi:6-phosphofructo-2-kinase-domain-containing protein, partial [Ochromonadaceae sp. CCMP2298]
MEKEPQQSGYGWVIAAVAIPVTLAGVYFWTRGSKKGGRGGEGGEGGGGGVDAFTIRSSSFHKSESFFEEQKDSPSATTAWVSLGLEQPLVIAMVGLPARGKSYIVKMTIRYLKWIGFECKVFNVGAYRRKHGMAAADSNFFDGNNMEAQQIREDMAVAVQ